MADQPELTPKGAERKPTALKHLKATISAPNLTLPLPKDAYYGTVSAIKAIVNSFPIITETGESTTVGKLIENMIAKTADTAHDTNGIVVDRARDSLAAHAILATVFNSDRLVDMGELRDVLGLTDNRHDAAMRALEGLIVKTAKDTLPEAVKKTNDVQLTHQTFRR